MLLEIASFGTLDVVSELRGGCSRKLRGAAIGPSYRGEERIQQCRGSEVAGWRLWSDVLDIAALLSHFTRLYSASTRNLVAHQLALRRSLKLVCHPCVRFED